MTTVPTSPWIRLTMCVGRKNIFYVFSCMHEYWTRKYSCLISLTMGIGSKIFSTYSAACMNIGQENICFQSAWPYVLGQKYFLHVQLHAWILDRKIFVFNQLDHVYWVKIFSTCWAACMNIGQENILVQSA